MLGDPGSVAKSTGRSYPQSYVLWARLFSSVPGMRCAADHAGGPVARPHRGRLTVEAPEPRGVVHRVNRFARAAQQHFDRAWQVQRIERLRRCGADQIALRADLVGAVVQRTEAAGPLAGHRHARRNERNRMQCDFRTLTSWRWADALADTGLPATVCDQRHTEHAVRRDGPPAVSDVAGDVAADHRPLGETDDHVAGQGTFPGH